MVLFSLSIYAGVTESPTVRGMIRFNNKVTRNAVLDIINTNKNFSKTVQLYSFNDYDIGGATITACYDVTFSCIFSKENEDKFNNLVDLAHSIKINNDCIEARIEIFTDFDIPNVPDTFTEIITK